MQPNLLFGQAPHSQFVSVKSIVDPLFNSFCNIVAKIPPPPQNPRCLNLAQYLVKHYENPTDVSIKEKLKRIVSEMNRIQDVPKSKGRLCGGLLHKGDKAYRCYECMTQQNSVLCPQCFQLDKHIGHEFQRFEVYGGCCDCGDIQKWKEQGFCSQHCKKQEKNMVLDQNLLNLFIEQQKYVLTALLELYTKFIFCKETVEGEEWEKERPQRARQRIRQEVIKVVKEQVDFYGQLCLTQLVEFNKAGIYANQMTGNFFEQTIPERGQKKVIEHLFSMTQSKIIANRVSDLCITMFPLEGFRERVTELYIRLYNSKPSFPPSAYSHLSSQLLTSYMVITKLVRQGRIEPIKYFPTCQKFQDISSVCDGFLRYYYDIRYLSRLCGSAAVDYFRFYASQKMFHPLGYYRVIFDKFEQAIDYYGLEQIFLERMIPLFKVIQRDYSLEISDMVLRELYHFITQQPTSAHNMFRPQERMFTIILFMRLNGDLSKLDDPETMSNLLMLLQINNFEKEMTTLLVHLRSIFLMASKMLENSNCVLAKYTFYSFYLKKSHLLFNSDALLLKIIIKMCNHHNQHYAKFEYERLLLEGDNNPVNAIKNATKEQDIQNMTEEQKQQMHERIIQQTNEIKYLKSYFSLLTQAMFSDLSQLALMCALQPTDFQVIKKYNIQKMPIRKLAMHYYECLLRTEDTNKIPIKQFKKTAERFFKQQQIFKQFVAQHIDPIDPLKLVKIEDEGCKINIHYFKSISALQSQKHKNSIGNPPYMSWKSHRCLDAFIKAIEQAIQLAKYNQNILLREMAEGRGTNISYLVLEIWKVAKITCSPSYINLLSNCVKDEWIVKELYELGNEIATIVTSGSLLIENKMNDEKKKSQMKRKLIQKKMKLKQKMRDNTEKAFEKMQTDDPSFQSQQGLANRKPSIERYSQNECCLCKEGQETESLYLLSLVTFSTGNGWIGIDHSKNLIPLFDSCGHAVHLTCHHKMRRRNEVNRVFSYCHLCKSASNILLPEKRDIKIEDALTFVNHLERVYGTLDISFDQKKVPEDICRSLVFEIILKGFIQQNELKKNIVTYSKVYNIYQHLYKAVGIDEPKKSTGELICFEDTPVNLRNIIVSITAAVNGHPISIGLSQNFDSHTAYLLSMLRNQNQPNLTNLDPPEVNFIKQTIVFPSLQKNLAQMNSKYRGKCPQCGLITNNQMICLSCPNFISCSNCQKIKITNHAESYHCGIAVFIKTSTGQLIYLMRNRYWKFQSLYEDYMGRCYTESSKHREQFNLNKNRYFEVQKDILCCKVQLRVRYKEVVTKTVHNSDIY